MAYWMERYSAAEIAALEQIGAAIRAARLRIPWSQHALARRCGLSQSSISRLEAGKAPTVRVARLARILVVLEARLVIEILPPRVHSREGPELRPEPPPVYAFDGHQPGVMGSVGLPIHAADEHHVGTP
jgi:transcriptional regulator with XRE-family HTH domain